ncbi:MAG: HisA/HisF-related TIM barrel protein [Gemmatimonadales bacterium]|nr:HisA/HisF-related TIM barrel protein [Gemmatimonadales bacterium]
MALELIPVLDLAAGRAVHARGGDRARYVAVASHLAPDMVPGDALALARAYRGRLGARRCYVADLDAIQGGTPQLALRAALAEGAGFPDALLVDAGARRWADAADAPPTECPVLGVETFRAWEPWGAVGRAVVSLDLRQGRLLSAGPWGGRDPGPAARWFAEHGVRELVLLDLARVGSGEGPDWDAIAAVRRAAHGARVLVGGGVRDAADLRRLEEAGADGVLLASALHSGALAPPHRQ